MPNWCNNSITIRGSKDKIKSLWDAANVTEDKGLLNALHPEPTYDTDGEWYGWRTANWGTKWEVGKEGLEFVDEGEGAAITGWFDSAWSPPVDALRFYCEQNPDVMIDATYFEPGLCFVGRWLHLPEEGVDDQFYEYGGHSSDNVRDHIGEYLDDQWNISEELAQYEEEENG